MTHIKSSLLSLWFCTKWMNNVELEAFFQSRSVLGENSSISSKTESQRTTIYIFQFPLTSFNHLFSTSWADTTHTRSRDWSCNGENRDRVESLLPQSPQRTSISWDAEYVRNFPDARVQVNKLSLTRKKRLSSSISLLISLYCMPLFYVFSEMIGRKSQVFSRAWIIRVEV